jgi:hypothetical protein
MGRHLDHEQRTRRWYAAASACGLANVRMGRTHWFPRQVEADAGPLQVILTSSAAQEIRGGGSVIVSGVAPELATAASFEPGDPLPRIGGPPLLRAALFDALTRRLVAGLLDSRIERADGNVEAFKCTVRIATGVLWVTHESALTPDALSAVLEIARRLTVPPALELTAADVLRRETEAPCRLNALKALLAEAPDHPATFEATRACLGDPAPEVRVEAALARREGREVLRELARSPDAPDHVSARAVAALQAELRSAALAEVLRTALARRRPRAAIACIEALGTRGSDDSPLLVQALGYGDSRVVLAAAGALARVGATADVVVALREAETRHAANRAVRNAARAAVGAVQARLEGAEAGQLSVTGDGAGRLALADDGSGRLAFPTPDDPPSDRDAVDAPGTGR